MGQIPPLIRALVDASVDAAAVVGPQLELLHFNSNYLRLAGLRPRTLAGTQPSGMCHTHFGLESCVEGCVSLRAFRARRACRVDEVRSGTLPLRLIVLAIPLLDERGEVLAVLETYRDVTAESRLQENYRRLLDQERAQKDLLAAEVARQTLELEAANAGLRSALREVSRVARTDGLTGLANRRCFDERLGQMVAAAERRGTRVALLLFDLDHFKRVNDEQGHEAGDQLLIAFARVLESAVRETDLVARVGGEEFAVLLPDAEASEAAAAGARVQERGRQADLPVTTSGGYAVYPEDGHGPSQLLRSADRGLYAAKRGGRNRIVAGASVPLSLPAGSLPPRPERQSRAPGGDRVSFSPLAPRR